MNIEQQRKAFDEWYGIKPKGWFEAIRYNTAWKAWLAAQKQEGYVMVPVEPTNGMDLVICKMVDHRIDCFEADRIYKTIIEESQK